MPNKSQQLLTTYGKLVADKLRKQGWKQKEYLSAGVIALVGLSPTEQLKCKELAYSKELDRGVELRIAVELLGNSVRTGFISPEQLTKEIEKLKKLVPGDKNKATLPDESDADVIVDSAEADTLKRKRNRG